MRCAYTNLVETPEVKNARRWERDAGGRVVWQGPVGGSSERGNEPWSSIKGGQLDRLSYCQLLV